MIDAVSDDSSYSFSDYFFFCVGLTLDFDWLVGVFFFKGDAGLF
jgi:hypothetical protein